MLPTKEKCFLGTDSVEGQSCISIGELYVLYSFDDGNLDREGPDWAKNNITCYHSRSILWIRILPRYILVTSLNIRTLNAVRQILEKVVFEVRNKQTKQRRNWLNLKGHNTHHSGHTGQMFSN